MLQVSFNFGKITFILTVLPKASPKILSQWIGLYFVFQMCALCLFLRSQSFKQKPFNLGSQWPANPHTGLVIKKSFIRLSVSLKGIWLPSERFPVLPAAPAPTTVVLQQATGKEVKGHPMQSAGQDFKKAWGKTEVWNHLYNSKQNNKNLPSDSRLSRKLYSNGNTQ